MNSLQKDTNTWISFLACYISLPLSIPLLPSSLLSSVTWTAWIRVFATRREPDPKQCEKIGVTGVTTLTENIPPQSNTSEHFVPTEKWRYKTLNFLRFLFSSPFGWDPSRQLFPIVLSMLPIQTKFSMRLRNVFADTWISFFACYISLPLSIPLLPSSLLSSVTWTAWIRVFATRREPDPR
jgi:hypothetical protein